MRASILSGQCVNVFEAGRGGCQVLELTFRDAHSIDNKDNAHNFLLLENSLLSTCGDTQIVFSLRPSGWTCECVLISKQRYARQRSALLPVFLKNLGALNSSSISLRSKSRGMGFIF